MFDKTTQEQIDELLAEGQTPGVKVVETSESPTLTREWFSRKKNRESVTLELLLHNADMAVETIQIRLKAELTVGDKARIQQAVNAYPISAEQLKPDAERSQEEEEMLHLRAEARSRMSVVVSFLAPSFHYDDADATEESIPIHEVDSATLEALFVRGYVTVHNPDIEAKTLAAFHGV